MTSTPDGAAAPADPAGNADATVLVPTARTGRTWLRLAREHPVPALLTVSAVVAWPAFVGTAPAWVADGLQPLSWLLPVAALVLVRDRLLSASSTQVPASVPERPTLDARTSAPLPPTWTWNSPLGRTAATAGTVAGAATIGFAAGAVAGAIDASAAAVAMSVLLGLLALVAGVVTWTVLADVPTACRHIIRHGASTPATVLGFEHVSQRCHLQPFDDGQHVVVEAFRGRSRLMAGDVVLLWQAPERTDAFDHRVAVTGPFGSLWPSVPYARSTRAKRRRHRQRRDGR